MSYDFLVSLTILEANFSASAGKVVGQVAGMITALLSTRTPLQQVVQL